jgi:hypothetical protein
MFPEKLLVAADLPSRFYCKSQSAATLARTHPEIWDSKFLKMSYLAECGLDSPAQLCNATANAICARTVFSTQGWCKRLPIPPSSADLYTHLAFCWRRPLVLGKAVLPDIDLSLRDLQPVPEQRHLLRRRAVPRKLHLPRWLDRCPLRAARASVLRDQLPVVACQRLRVHTVLVHRSCEHLHQFQNQHASRWPFSCDRSADGALRRGRGDRVQRSLLRLHRAKRVGRRPVCDQRLP